ncbi:MAG: cysteine desulfurase [Solirubrobacterales bacterium]|nr:cysteine desulfurase [Solirubrobacterales bacterium]
MTSLLADSGFDVAAVRADFPVLSRQVNGHPLVYLDNASSSHKPTQVLDAERAFVEQHYSNVHRGVHTLSQEATDAYEAARDTVARFLGAPDSHEVVFTKNATEAYNLVAYSFGNAAAGSRFAIGPGDEVCVTEMEHHSNLVPWQMLAQRTGAELAFVAVDADGRLDLESLDALLARGPKLVAVTHVSNVLGTINPVADIVSRGHAAGAVVLVDGSQAVPHLPVDLREIDADFYAWTGHKAYGPTGIGVLHGRRSLLEAMPPFLGGGSMISRVELHESRYAEPPARFEAGTSAIAEGIGLGVACEYLRGIGMEHVRDHGRDIVGYAVERLSEVPGLELHGPSDPDARAALCSFAIEGVHPHDVAEILGRDNVCVRAGHHCAQPLMRKLGVSATSRASFALHSTRDDVDRLVTGLHDVRRIFAL